MAECNIFTVHGCHNQHHAQLATTYSILTKNSNIIIAFLSRNISKIPSPIKDSNVTPSRLPPHGIIWNHNKTHINKMTVVQRKFKRRIKPNYSK